MFGAVFSRIWHYSFVKRLIAWIFFALLSTPAMADVPVPKIPQAKGDTCVEETAFMRRNHMTVLKHQRDDTLRKGIRTKKHSLQGCLDCHAVFETSASKSPVSIKSEKHFCNSCHNYVAVKIDCFDCHSSKPFVRKSPLTLAPL